MKDPQQLLNFAKDNRLDIVSIEQDSRSTSLYDHTPKDNAIYVLGNEVSGVSKELLDNSHILEIKHTSGHNSLNVEVTAGILLFKLASN